MSGSPEGNRISKSSVMININSARGLGFQFDTEDDRCKCVTEIHSGTRFNTNSLFFRHGLAVVNCWIKGNGVLCPS